MLQHFFKRMLRLTERKAVRPAGRQRSLRVDGARPETVRPTGAFLAQLLRSALALKHAESRGGRPMQQSPYEPSSKPAQPDAEQPDGKVVRLMPRRCPATEQAPKPPAHDDDNDPGPSAA
jgi:hypothetical protein